MKLMLDTQCFECKPTGNEIGKINNRIIKNKADINIDELANAISTGRTFVPALIDTKHNGKLSRTINCWTSQEVICLDFDDGMRIEEAIEIFQNKAVFIYKTFNYTEECNKFRVVFVLNEVVSNYDIFSNIINKLLEEYSCADSSCSDGSRMFFGGTEIIKLNYNNRLNIADYISNHNTYNDITENGCAGVFSTNDTLIPKDIIGRKTPPLDDLCEKSEEIQGLLDGYIHNECREFAHINDAYDYLYKMDMAEYLNELGYDLNGSKFNCIFHDDYSPSASIFQDSKTGNYMYKCHSKKCGFTGNIIRVTERISGLKRVDVFKRLCKYYNIKIVETEWQKEQKEIMDHNIHFLTSESLKEEYPDFYKRIKRYIPLLIVMNLFSKQYIGTNTLKEIEKSIFTTSKSYLSQMAKELSVMIYEMYDDKLEYTKINSDVKEISKRIDLFAFLGVLEKIHINDLPKELKAIANMERSKKLKRNPDVNYQNYYMIPEYSDQLMTNANQKSIEFKESNMSMLGFGREMMIRGKSKEEADKVYPMLSRLELSKQSNEVSEYIKKKFIDKINTYGWVAESEILDELIKENLEKTNGQIKGKIKNMKNIKKSLNELVEGYDLKRDRLNKKLIKDLNIDPLTVTGYPFIIYK